MKKGIHPENYRTVLFYDSNAKQGFLIRSCAKTNNTMTVSYTHLDVYKRQDINSPLPYQCLQCRVAA